MNLFIKLNSPNNVYDVNHIIKFNPTYRYQLGFVKCNLQLDMLNISAAIGNNIFTYSANNGTTFVSRTLPDGFYDINSVNYEIGVILLNDGFSNTAIQFQGSSATGFLRVFTTVNFQWNSASLGTILGFTSAIYTSITLATSSPSLNLGITNLFIELANTCKNRSYRNSNLTGQPARINFCNFIYSSQLLLIPSASIEITAPVITYVDMIQTEEVGFFEIYIRDQNNNILTFTPTSELNIIINKK